MKKKLMVMVVLTAAIISGGTGAVFAGCGRGGGFGGPHPGMEMGSGNFDALMAKVLKLTDVQQKQIKALLDAEREQVKPLFDKLHRNRILLMQTADATVFNEAAVRALAADQAKIETELTVSRIKVQSRISSLLTPEQRELQKNLRPDMDPQPPQSKGE
jgi:periplasmic protein CpxP/Spy